ncbi:ATP-binding protein [Reyranella sp. CPCC 100927]|uniref:ATP-binding protein n=1 Tax=Reyranella sp. CPCC 100927 TaxID=2599616 RepID=UPI001C498C21|nr:ATP-binding protein [Reyranella sp. CPCC 100927]
MPVTEASQIAAARRGAVALAQAGGLGETDAGRVALVASELATNLVRHGGGGNLLARLVEPEAEPAGIELMALDQGPGIADVQACLRDGFSTGGTNGTGLGAIRRQADAFDIFSLPGKGAGVLACLRARRGVAPQPGPASRQGCVSVPKSGENVCGDAWAVSQTEGPLTAMVVDGLGHGTFAAEAAHHAVRVFRQRPFEAPRPLLQAIHAALRPTRGAAAAVAFVDTEQSRVVFAGIGNIAATLIANGQSRRLVSLNGIVGHTAQRIQEFTYPFSGGQALLILHSDGLATSWTLDQYPGLASRHPSLIAGVLFRDFGRGGRDDATVLVIRSAA